MGPILYLKRLSREFQMVSLSCDLELEFKFEEKNQQLDSYQRLSV